MKTILHLVVCFSISALALQLQAAEYLWLEAETGGEYDPVVVKSDPSASQDIYLASWSWADYGSRSADDGMIVFSVDITEAGDYTLWGRMKTPWGGIRPYDISIDNVSDFSADSKWLNWKPDDRTEAVRQNWNWSNSGLIIPLTAGKHTITFVQREGGPNLHLDKILLTNDFTFEPKAIGGEEQIIDNPSRYESNIVNSYGSLQVIGTQLSDEHGNPVQLQGISTHGLQWFPLIRHETIPNMAKFFGAEVVRLAMYIEDYSPTDESDFWGGYVSDKQAMIERTRAAIDDAIDAGIYVIIDWHIHNVPTKYIDEANEFYNTISEDYGHYPNVIYEICNEPLPQADWLSIISPYADTIISTIRKNDPDNLILVGTPTWSQDVDIAAQYPLGFDNIMYTFHYYSGTHDINQMKNKVENALAAGAPIFISEWGSSDVGTSYSDFYIADQWMTFMNEHNLSWTNWSLGNKDEASSILDPTAYLGGPWTDSDLTAAGRWLKPYFDTPNGSEPDPVATPTPVPTLEPTPTPVPSLEPTPTPTPTPTPEPMQCDWYGWPVPVCTQTTTGWGYENQETCISRAECGDKVIQ